MAIFNSYVKLPEGNPQRIILESLPVTSEPLHFCCQRTVPWLRREMVRISAHRLRISRPKHRFRGMEVPQNGWYPLKFGGTPYFRKPPYSTPELKKITEDTCTKQCNRIQYNAMQCNAIQYKRNKDETR